MFVNASWHFLCQFADVEVDVVHEDFATQDDVYQETFRPIVNSFLQVME